MAQSIAVQGAKERTIQNVGGCKRRGEGGVEHVNVSEPLSGIHLLLTETSSGQAESKWLNLCKGRDEERGSGRVKKPSYCLSGFLALIFPWLGQSKP